METLGNRMTAMEEKQSSDIQQVLLAIDKLSKTMEENNPKNNPAPDHRAGKQPMFPHTEPLLDTPLTSVGNGSGVTQYPPYHDPPHQAYDELNQRHLRTPRIDVPIFSGNGVVGWLYQINRYFHINHTPPDQMLESAPLFMAGDALLWFQWKDITGQVSSWAKLSQDIHRRFGPSEYYDAEVAINQLTQHTSVQTYIAEFEKLSASAPRLVGPNLLSRFIAGLKEDIRHELVIFKPHDLDKAMGLARVIEDKILSQRRLSPCTPSSKPPYRPYPESPRPNTNPLPIKRLTPTEMAARRAKGLCFNCDENFTPGHVCRPRFQCLLMEDLGDTDGFELVKHDTTDHPDQADPTDPATEPNPAPCITFHALQGQAAPCTLRFHATIRGQPVLVLVDSGSTHNFLQTRLARFLKLAIEPSAHLSVTVGNGDEIQCEGVCHAVPVQIEGNVFPVELHLLPVFGADLVLGAQWLAEVGPTTFCFKNMWMSLQRQDQHIQIFGLKPTTQISQTSASQIHKTSHQKGTLCLLQLFTTWAPTPTSDTPDSPVPDLALPLHLPPELHKGLTSLLHTYSTVFDPPHGLPPHRSTDHTIPLINGANPITVRPYRYPHYQKTEIETMIKTMLADGIIRPSHSPFSLPVLLVKKKDGSWQFCVDYHALNTITIKDKFPIPTVDELLDELHGSTLFTKLDLRAGYHQLRMNEADVYKTAFRTHEGHYEFLVMPFGLTNAPASFQAEMNTIFKPLLRRCVLVFFYDILVYSATPTEHLSHLEEVLMTLRSHCFYAKPSKCDFARTSLTYLGHVISHEGVAVDPDKITAIQKCPQPKSIKQLRRFLGLTGYYRRFVKNYASIAAPLTNLLRKDAYLWSPPASLAFQQLRQALSSTPVLVLPNFASLFHLQIDASGTGIGAVLAQGGRPVSYWCFMLHCSHSQCVSCCTATPLYW
ncbi:unnamed protein product [Rhodiola kirilowii]